MALFKLFSSKNVANSDVNPVEIYTEQDKSEVNEVPIEEPNGENGKKHFITLTWGTGMPIDIIFNFIHKDFFI